MKLGAGILLLVDALAFGVLMTFLVWAHDMFTVGVVPRAAVIVFATFVAFVGLNAYVGARLIYAWLRELAARHAARIEQIGNPTARAP